MAFTLSRRLTLPRSFTVPRRGACAAALVLFMAFASGPALSQAPNAESIAAARQLIEMKGAGAIFDAVVPGVIETVKNTFLRTNPQLAQELNAVSGELQKEYEARRGDPMEQVAQVFAERFTLQELREAITFYKTPLGKKLIDLEAPTLEEGMQRAETWANKLADEILVRMRTEMKKRGHAI